VGGAVAEAIFKRGLCLPSGSSLTVGELDRVIDVFYDTVVRKRIIPVPELVLTAASHA
jgi:hypothetical protein